MIFCKDCRHYQASTHSDDPRGEYAKCHATDALLLSVSPVTGVSSRLASSPIGANKVCFIFCAQQRESAGACGPDATLFEPEAA